MTSGRDNAFTGIGNQRPNQVSDGFHGGTLTNYLNRAAFAQPDPGTLGNLPRNAVTGPNRWNVNLAVSRLIALAGTQRLEFNWGNPATNFNSGQFGRITSLAGDPRIMQFGIKYDL